MKKLLMIVASALIFFGCSSNDAKQEDDGWISLFDGKTLDGWKASENPSTFSVKDGAIAVDGERSHLFYVGPVNNHNFKNFEFKATIMTRPGANSGMYFHTEYQEEDWPRKGLEVQVNNTQEDWRRTGSVYARMDIKEALAKDNEWFTQHIIVQGKKITVKINDKVINEYTEPDDEKAKMGSGTFALQGHDPGSKVFYKDVMVKVLPD
jgi:hypothetical protein